MTSSKCPDLPFLPGYTFNPMIGRTKFNMDPKFDFIGEGVRALVERVKPNMFGPLSDKYPSVYARGEVTELPAWIAFDKQILCFDAYFKETLQEVRASPFQVRKVKIYFFLEDGTIQVVEPKVENSGVAQGTLITRHRIRFPAPMDENFYDLIDLNVGLEIEFYGRIFKVVDCDKFTRNFLNRCGIAVPDPCGMPHDPYLSSVLGNKTGKKLLDKSMDRLGKFLANDRKVLRFYGTWDDRKTEYGYLHDLEVFYYLADDTIEIKEIDRTNNTSFTFLRKIQIPKVYRELPGPGSSSAMGQKTILNVLPKGYCIDSLDVGREVIDYYSEEDFSIGAILNCYGRRIVLTGSDPYTKEYYRVKYGVVDDHDCSLTINDNNDTISSSLVKEQRELPPWNGYGSYEDSAQNCVTVEPKAPLKDFKKFLQFDRIGLDSHILRFAAKMISKYPEDCDRNFIISYYLADNTISIFEFAKRNSGFASKPFLQRDVVQLPGQNPFQSQPPICYKPDQMYIDSKLIINNGFQFLLTSADEYALRYMELNSHQFPKANITMIMDKIRAKLKPVYKEFVAENMPKESTVISYQKLKHKLSKIMTFNDNFTEHEMITLSRAYSTSMEENLREKNAIRDRLRAVALTELKKLLWDDLERLKEYFLVRDEDRSGKLSKRTCYSVLRGCRLPLDCSMIDKILDTIKQDDRGYLIYSDIFDFLNRDLCPMTDVEPINTKHDLCFDAFEKTAVIPTYIDWCRFNKDLDLEKTFKEGAEGADGRAKNNTIDSIK